MGMKKDMIAGWFKNLQDDICNELEQLDGKGRFQEDLWERPGGGGGRTRIIGNGNILEKGGVNYSEVSGKTTGILTEKQGLPETDFYATGISVVLHPFHPMIPIIHMNTRYFEMGTGEKWFGGGIDLTPHYVFPEDATFFHIELKKVCDRFDPAFYPAFKQEADKYFYLKHRNETRGVGGIFFDRLSGRQAGKMEKLYKFTKAVGSVFMPVYRELVYRNRNKTFGKKEKEWQEIRRGRYVEFNLLWDRGTQFGLGTNGRTESILMSLPSSAIWIYDHRPGKNSKEKETLDWLKKGIDWIHLKATT
jgi:coproporphyrinogen III oxidase